MFYILVRNTSPNERVPLKKIIDNKQENIRKDKKTNKSAGEDESYFMNCANLKPPTYLVPNETSSILNDPIWYSSLINDKQFCQSIASQCIECKYKMSKHIAIFHVCTLKNK